MLESTQLELFHEGFINWDLMPSDVSLFVQNEDGSFAYGKKVLGRVDKGHDGWIIRGRGYWDWPEGDIPKEVFIAPLPKPWYKCTSIRPGSDIIINLRGAS